MAIRFILLSYILFSVFRLNAQKYTVETVSNDIYTPNNLILNKKGITIPSLHKKVSYDSLRSFNDGTHFFLFGKQYKRDINKLFCNSCYAYGLQLSESNISFYTASTFRYRRGFELPTNIHLRYLKKGSNKLKNIQYSSLKIDLSDHNESMEKLKEIDKHTLKGTVLLVVGLPAASISCHSLMSDNALFLSTPNLLIFSTSVSLVYMAIYHLIGKRRDICREAIKIYNTSYVPTSL